ncbi:hypothetical protein ANCCAN_09395, partial [Ancylostoma caninum]
MRLCFSCRANCRWTLVHLDELLRTLDHVHILRHCFDWDSIAQTAFNDCHCSTDNANAHWCHDLGLRAIPQTQWRGVSTVFRQSCHLFCNLCLVFNFILEILQHSLPREKATAETSCEGRLGTVESFHRVQTGVYVRIVFVYLSINLSICLSFC